MYAERGAGGKIFRRLHGRRPSGGGGRFFLFHANSLQMDFQASACITNGAAKRFERAYLSEKAGWR